MRRFQLKLKTYCPSYLLVYINTHQRVLWTWKNDAGIFYFFHSKILDFMQHLLCWYICPFLWKYAVSFSVELEALMWQKREMMCQTHPFMWALGEPGKGWQRKLITTIKILLSVWGFVSPANSKKAWLCWTQFVEQLFGVFFAKWVRVVTVWEFT